jgi:hypothetical protein
MVREFRPAVPASGNETEGSTELLKVFMHCPLSYNFLNKAVWTCLLLHPQSPPRPSSLSLAPACCNHYFMADWSLSLSTDSTLRLCPMVNLWFTLEATLPTVKDLWSAQKKNELHHSKFSVGSTFNQAIQSVSYLGSRITMISGSTYT